MGTLNGKAFAMWVVRQTDALEALEAERDRMRRMYLADPCGDTAARKLAHEAPKSGVETDKSTIQKSEDDMNDLPSHLVAEIQKHTKFPWWNGQAYAEYIGWPQTLGNARRDLNSVDVDLHDVIEWLRKKELFAQADRLRVVRGRLQEVIADLSGSDAGIRARIARLAKHGPDAG